LKPGHHVLEIHVADAGSNFDQNEKVQTDFVANAERILIVNCDKRKMQVSLK
jgi:hypothetical protein